MLHGDAVILGILPLPLPSLRQAQARSWSVRMTGICGVDRLAGCLTRYEVKKSWGCAPSGRIIGFAVELWDACVSQSRALGPPPFEIENRARLRRANCV